MTTKSNKMQSYQSLKQSCVLITLLTLFSLISIQSNWSSVQAQTQDRPPANPHRQTRRSGGMRGGCSPDIKQDSITLVVPEDEQSLNDLPKTTSAHPTLVWHLAQKSDVPVKFTLVKPGQTIYVEELKLPDKGLVALTLPETVPALKIGEQYRWTVSLLCSRQNPSRNPYAQAWVERISPSPKKSTVSCHTDKKAEIWYDYMACQLKSQSEAKILGLLQQVKLGYLLQDNQFSRSNNLLNLSSWLGLTEDR